jgi:hypothetical protein
VCKRKLSWPHLKYYPSICLQGNLEPRERLEPETCRMRSCTVRYHVNETCGRANCSIIAGETTCLPSCSLGAAVTLSPIGTAVTWQWVSTRHNTKDLRQPKFKPNTSLNQPVQWFHRPNNNSSSLCRCLHTLVTSTFLCPNILLSAPESVFFPY